MSDEVPVNQVLCGDCRAIMKVWPESCVDLAVTSPPYWGLRDYGVPPTIWGGDPTCNHEWGENLSWQGYKRGNKPGDYSTSTLTNPDRQDEISRPTNSGSFCSLCGAWLGCLGLEPHPQMYIDHMVEVAHEIKRVLNPHGSYWLNLGDSYCSITGGTDPAYDKSDLTGNKHKGHQNRARYYGPSTSWLQPKQLLLIPSRVAIALQEDGWLVRNAAIWYKPNHMPESTRDRFTSSYEFVFFLVRSDARSNYHIVGNQPNKEKQPLRHLTWLKLKEWWRDHGGVKRRDEIPKELLGATINLQYYFDLDAIREPYMESSIQRITQPTVMQQMGGDKQGELYGDAPGHGNRPADIVKGLAERYETKFDSSTQYNQYQQRRAQARREGKPHDNALGNSKGKNPGDLWEINTYSFSGAHFAVFPPALIEPIIKAGCPRNGVVLDPFAGSGTALRVARRLGRRFIGIEINPEYVEMCERRIRTDSYEPPPENVGRLTEYFNDHE